MKDYEIQDFQEMSMEALIDILPTKQSYADLIYFLVHEGILVPYTTKNK